MNYQQVYSSLLSDFPSHLKNLEDFKNDRRTECTWEKYTIKTFSAKGTWKENKKEI